MVSRQYRLELNNAPRSIASLDYRRKYSSNGVGW
jgi:hypothetical protein